MKILVAGRNIGLAAAEIQQIAEAEKIQLKEVYAIPGNPDRIPNGTDLVVFLYDEATVKVPRVVEEFKNHLVFPESGIEKTVTRQMLRSLDRALRARRH